MNLPIPYNVENIAKASFSPSTFHLADNASFGFYARYLWQKMINVFKFTLPDDWDEDYFKYVLFGIGYIPILYTNEFGVIPQYGTAGGYNQYFEPDFVNISNELLPDESSRELKIGRDCEVVRLAPDWGGAGDLIGFYAAKMALCSQSIDINLINSKVAFVFGAKSKAQAEAFKKMYQDITSGEPAVVIDKFLFSEEGEAQWQLFSQNLKNTYLVSDIISDMRKLEEEFDTKIGIPNANTDKRERLNTDEVNANNVETEMIAEGWLNNIRKGFEKVKKLYPGINCSVDWRVKPNVTVSEQSDPIRN